MVVAIGVNYQMDTGYMFLTMKNLTTSQKHVNKFRKKFNVNYNKISEYERNYDFK